MSVKIEVFQARKEHWNEKDLAWYWHYRSSNGKITADSEAYPSRANAIRAAKAHVRAVFKVAVCAGDPLKFDVSKPDANGVTLIKWY